jgi:hypothetical protein
MTQTAAIAKALLEGKVLSIMNGFKLFSCTNIPREISRSIEKKFGVEVSRDKVEFVSKYKQPGVYFRYRLNRTEQNMNGIIKMERYVEEHMPKKEQAISKPITAQQLNLL